jgi:GT2 family glycosyltransferase
MKDAVWFIFVFFKPSKEQTRRCKQISHLVNSFMVDNTEENHGYGGGANVGIQYALEHGAEWVVICNQDIVMPEKDIKTFVETLKKSEPGIFGPEVGSFDTRRWTTILPAKGSVDYVSGSCMAIHKNVLQTVGAFYEPYFMYYEDADFSVRAKKAGFPLHHVELSGFKHNLNFASGRKKEYYLARNHLLFALRNAPWQVKLHELLRLPKTLYDYWR